MGFILPTTHLRHRQSSFWNGLSLGPNYTLCYEHLRILFGFFFLIWLLQKAQSLAYGDGIFNPFPLCPDKIASLPNYS